MGNGVWTVEIIPAEIQPPARERQGASGIRVRMGSKYMTNMGNEADMVVAFNEQVLYSRIIEPRLQKRHGRPCWKTCGPRIPRRRFANNTPKRSPISRSRG